MGYRKKGRTGPSLSRLRDLGEGYDFVSAKNHGLAETG
ncbi:hypothetical protein BREVNS_1208 [Brevinematales bacterium NS]|nr:hypothetical protein BREVNS_1208 [Brevinematales bacterium NS]